MKKLLIISILKDGSIDGYASEAIKNWKLDKKGVGGGGM